MIEAIILEALVTGYPFGMHPATDATYMRAVRWNLKRKGRHVPGVTDITDEQWAEKLRKKGYK